MVQGGVVEVKGVELGIWGGFWVFGYHRWDGVG